MARRYLLDQNRNARLSEQETEALDEMERSYNFMLILKAKTRLYEAKKEGANPLS